MTLDDIDNLGIEHHQISVDVADNLLNDTSCLNPTSCVRTQRG